MLPRPLPSLINSSIVDYPAKQLVTPLLTVMFLTATRIEIGYTVELYANYKPTQANY